MRNIGYLAGIVLTIAVASWFAFDVSRAGTSAVFIYMGVPTVALALVGVWRAKSDGVMKEWFGVKSGDFSRGFGAAAGLFGLAYAFSKIVTPATSPKASWMARLYLQLGDPSMLRKQVVWVVAAIIIISIAEELLWRGLVTSLLEEVIGSRRAWVWAAVLYALAHVPTVWALRDPEAGPNPVLIAAALGCGLVWGGMRRWFGRILPGVFSHILFDWAVMMMFRLWGPSI